MVGGISLKKVYNRFIKEGFKILREHNATVRISNDVINIRFY